MESTLPNCLPEPEPPHGVPDRRPFFPARGSSQMEARKPSNQAVDARTEEYRLKSAKSRRLRLRSLAARAVCGFLTITAILTLPVQTQAQTTIWSSTLTVQNVETDILGCSLFIGIRCSDNLSDDDFTYNRTTYRFLNIYIYPPDLLRIALGAALLRRRPKGLLPAARQELLDPSKAWWGGRRGRLADRPRYSISVSLGVVPRWYSRVVEVPVRIEVTAGFVAPGASEPPRLQPSWPPGGSRPAHG